MDLSSVVDLTITLSTVTLSRAAFGTPLIAAYHTNWPQRIKFYSSLTEMIADGFTIVSPAYLAAQSIFSQSPRPKQIAIGRRALPFTQTIELYPQITTEGFVYEFEIVSALGVTTSISYTVGAAATQTTIATALASLIDPIDSATATSSTVKVVITSTAGLITNLRNLPPRSVLLLKDVTTDPGIATDLAAIEAENSKDWYALLLDQSSPATITATAIWIQSRRKQAFVNTSDSACLDPSSTTDIAYTTKAASRSRTTILFSGNELQSYSVAAWVSVMLPKDPGSATWAFKKLANCIADEFTSTEQSALNSKNLNSYQNLGGSGVTFWGKDPTGGYTDIVLGIDWLFARIQEDQAAVFLANDQVPFNDSGIASFNAALGESLDRATKKPNAFILPGFTHSFPKLADISEDDKAARRLPNGVFAATITGAIHTVAITGTLVQ